MAVPSLSIKRLTSKWEKNLMYHFITYSFTVLGDTVPFVAAALHFGGERHKKWTSKLASPKLTVPIISIITSVSMEHQILTQLPNA